MNKIKQTLEKVLKQEEAFLDVETGELDYIKIKDSADKIDEKLIALLADNKELMNKFFSHIKDVYVFNINDFKFFLDESKIDNSYTKYANKIGLSDGSELLKNRSEVVLDFPFKDCVLEGGQSTEEGVDTYFEYEEEKAKTVEGKKVTEPAGYKEKQAKRKEVFFNQVLAHDEIDRLFEKKALVNWKRFTKNSGKNGEAVKEIKRNEGGLIKENLIIKGNNLLALHSLKSEFAGKVKLIYVDPPYYFKDIKTDDAFAYNSNFKLSTWLTFMKNRLDIARELLREDGVIFVQIKDDGMAHLKLLMDDVFIKNGGDFVNNIVVKMSEASGVKMAHSEKRFPNIKEYILFYKKSSSFNGFYRIDKYKSNEWDKENNIYLENFEYSDRQKLLEIEEKENITETDIKSVNEILKKAKKISLSEKIKSVPNEDVQDWLIENSYRIIKTAGSSSLAKQVKELKSVPKQDIASFTSKENVLFYFITDFNRETDSPRLQVLFADTSIYKNPCDFWQDIKTTGAIANERGVQLSGGKKPEKLLHRIIEMTTNEGDIVLDYYSGSGTTASVAHKMKRQWITIEQIDNQINLALSGLSNVLKGDTTGISGLVNWKGGGEFVYCELAKWNEQAKEEINDAKSLPELVKLLDTLYERYFLNYNVRIKDFKEKIIKEDNFKKLSLDEQKRMFLTMLDLNQMYVQESEMADKRFGISKEDQKLTKEFYKN